MTGQYMTDKAHGSGGRIVLLRLGHFGLYISDLVCGGRHLCEVPETLLNELGNARFRYSCLERFWSRCEKEGCGSEEDPALNTESIRL